jgi:HNH endonuclease
MTEPELIKPRRRRTRQEVQRLVSEFGTSGLPRGEFCRIHGMTLSTLQRGLKRERTESSDMQSDGKRLVRVKVIGVSGNEFLFTYRNPSDNKLDEFRQKFKQALKACYTVFGDKAFRLRKVSGDRAGEWVPRVNATIFQVLAVCFTDHDVGTITRSADSIFEAYLDLIATDATWVEAVTASTGDPNKIDYSFETWKQRLRKAVAKTVPNDPSRLFSRALKTELFAQNNVCALCGQSIVMIDDAALDHIEQYWEGGQTVPENARLVHRLCNFKRPRRNA